LRAAVATDPFENKMAAMLDKIRVLVSETAERADHGYRILIK
jgi:hypothetical protein